MLHLVAFLKEHQKPCTTYPQQWRVTPTPAGPWPSPPPPAPRPRPLPPPFLYSIPVLSLPTCLILSGFRSVPFPYTPALPALYGLSPCFTRKKWLPASMHEHRQSLKHHREQPSQKVGRRSQLYPPPLRKGTFIKGYTSRFRFRFPDLVCASALLEAGSPAWPAACTPPTHPLSSPTWALSCT